MRSIPLLAIAACAACGFDPYERCESPSAGSEISCPTPGEFDRAFDLRVPAGWDGSSPLPLIYAFHGGGGNRRAADQVTCPEGESESPECLSGKADAMGFAVARPDGTGNRPARNVRTWNAGGGTGQWECVSGVGCKSNVDDMAYLDRVHAEVERLIPVDSAAVYATGLSNGAAISHRLACERPARFAAIAAVGGNNQFAAAGGLCSEGVAILQLHGTDDPVWVYETSDEGGVVDSDKFKIGAEDSTAAWAERNGCSETRDEELLPDTVDDGTSSSRLVWRDCDRSVALIRINGGGHTWPQGDPYFAEDRIGKVAQDFDGDDLILEFFDANRR